MSNAYLKVKIIGQLTLQSELHIGSGEIIDIKQRLSKDELAKSGQPQGSYHALCKGEQGRPIIPGSSLRGALLAKLCREQQSQNDQPKWQSQPILRQLFGFTAENKALEIGERGAGKVRFNHATLAATGHKAVIQDNQASGALNSPLYYCQSDNTLLRPGVKIDQATGAAQECKLFHHEVVASGSRFDWEIAAENLSEKELHIVLQLLDCFDGSLLSAIGGKKNNSQGKIKWQRTEVKVVTCADYDAWLRQIADHNFQPLRYNTMALPNTINDHDCNDWLSHSAKGQKHYRLTINATAPILINDPHLVQQRKSENDVATPKAQFRRTYDGSPIIPASSLKGILKSQSERIAATIGYHQLAAEGKNSGDNQNDLIQAAVNAAHEYAEMIWGSECRQGALRFSDLTGENTGEDNLHHQYFTAIDRFTGGVMDSALYSAVASTCKQYNGECWLNKALLTASDEIQQHNKGWQALLLFTLRDAMSGELHIGSGWAKGYGAFTLKIDEKSDFEVFLAQHISTEQLDIWLTALKQNLLHRTEQQLNRLLQEQ